MVNKNYLEFINKPIEISLRNTIGKTFEVDNIKDIAVEIEKLKKHRNLELSEDDSIKKIIDDNFFKMKFFNIFLTSSFIILLFTESAFAYLDPGTEV